MPCNAFPKRWGSSTHPVGARWVVKTFYDEFKENIQQKPMSTTCDGDKALTVGTNSDRVPEAMQIL